MNLLVYQKKKKLNILYWAQHFLLHIVVGPNHEYELLGPLSSTAHRAS